MADIWRAKAYHGCRTAEVNPLNCHYSPLPREALLHINGPDSLQFLQGQTTCDTREISADKAIPGVYCTPQGRVVCDFLLCQIADEHFALRMRRDIREHAAQVLGKYIVFSKAELDSTNEDWQVVACWGDDSPATLARIFGATPETPGQCHRGDGFILVRCSTEEASFECYLASDSDHLQALADAATEAPAEAWEQHQIESGIARIEASTIEAFVPQVLNYDLTGHISFSKGCYTGQEVVARLHYRGKSKRRCFVTTLPDASNTGAHVYVAGGTQPVGDVVNSSGNRALVSATLDGAAQGLYLEEGGSGEQLIVDNPPYDIPGD